MYERNRACRKVFVILAACLLVTQASWAAPIVPLEPLVPGFFSGGDGVNSHWVQVDKDFKGPDHGLQSLADLKEALALSPGDPSLLGSYVGPVDQIDFADERFNRDWGPTWGTGNLPPLFQPGDANQDDYGARFWGHIAVTEAGLYNFGVLVDDAFSFTLTGAGAEFGLAQDGLNPRDIYAFAFDLDLSPGLYGFTLDTYEHLEVEVVRLVWWLGNEDWRRETIPPENFRTSGVPIPAPVWLLLPGLGVLAALRSRMSRMGNG